MVQQKNVVKDKSSQFLLPKGQGRIKLEMVQFEFIIHCWSLLIIKSNGQIVNSHIISLSQIKEYQKEILIPINKF